MTNFNDARTMGLLLYKSFETQNINSEDALKQAIDRTLPMYPGLEEERLRASLLESINISLDEDALLTNENDMEHIPWYYEQKGKQDLKFWRRYERYLNEKKHWPQKVIQSLDETTDRILDQLEDPKIKGNKYDRRGIVVGHVQSGKTANFTGLINKAIDMGYKLVIVLAGMHNSLRSQTQMRLDEEVLGYETSILSQNPNNNKLIGVSTLPGEGFLRINTLTTRDDSGDFSRSIARKVNVQPGVEPFLLVVKKNASVLQNVLNYFRNDSLLARMASEDAPHKTVPDVPMLLIDDEADQASINTSELYDEDGQLSDDYNPTKINGLIREIYNTFEQKAYVGYTATPFANIFVHNTAGTDKYGSELFPKDFIMSLPKPSNYTGPSEFFRLNEEDEEDNMLLIEPILYHENFVPLKHKKDHIPVALPDSLKKAILTFVLSTTIRRLRGQRKVHNSMLIHVTRFKDVQHHVAELVKEEMYTIKNRIRYGETSESTSILQQLKELFFDDIVPTSEKLKEPIHSWDEVVSELIPTVESIIVNEINGSSGDILDYKDNESTGLNVIAIGGDKLSRGLTLEGLTVSYYLRASKMYDTLMQMGRWFGYRPGYLDLCRIFTTSDLASWFRHIAIATEELRAEIDYMASIRATPAEFGLRVQTHPTMLVTSQLKMRSGQRQKLSYRNTVSETTVFDIDPDKFAHNFSVTDRFIKQLRAPEKEFWQMQRGGSSHHYFWPNVKGESVTEFLSQYKTAPSAPRANSLFLKKYIEKQLVNGELTDWTVCVINTGEEDHQYNKLGGLRDLRKGITRTITNWSSTDKTISVKRLMSAEHEYLDFNMDQMDKLKFLKDEDKGSYQTKAQKIRAKLRDPKKGLLVIYPIDTGGSGEFKNVDTNGIQPIGIALVFPETNHPEVAVDYVVNNVYSELEEQNA
jgi:hypothetical protein